MLENLQKSIRTAFGDIVTTSRATNGWLSVQVGHIEMTIDDTGQLMGVSGVGAACLNIDVDRLGSVIAATLPTVKTLGQ